MKRRSVAAPPRESSGRTAHAVVPLIASNSSRLDDRVSSAGRGCHRLRGGCSGLAVEGFTGILEPSRTGKLVLNVELEELHALHIVLDVLGDLDDGLEEGVNIGSERVQVKELLIVGDVGIAEVFRDFAARLGHLRLALDSEVLHAALEDSCVIALAFRDHPDTAADAVSGTKL